MEGSFNLIGERGKPRKTTKSVTQKKKKKILVTSLKIIFFPIHAQDENKNTKNESRIFCNRSSKSELIM